MSFDSEGPPGKAGLHSVLGICERASLLLVQGQGRSLVGPRGQLGAVGARPAGVVDEQMIVRDSGAAKCVNLGDFILRSSRDTSIANSHGQKPPITNSVLGEDFVQIKLLVLQEEQIRDTNGPLGRCMDEWDR